MHTPKTAGLTLHSILENKYPWFKHYVQERVDNGDFFKHLSTRKRNSFQVLRGHFPYGLHHYHNQKFTYLTLLRDPITRTISGYDYILRTHTHPFNRIISENKMSLNEFLERNVIKTWDNMQTRFLSGDISLESGGVNEIIFEKAKRNLSQVNMLFGITELFVNSINYFSKNLGWGKTNFKNKNEAGKYRYLSSPIDEKTTQTIVSKNQFDIKLYKWAKEEFEKKLIETNVFN